jgi:hypothetical protein
VSVPVSTMPTNTATTRAGTILSYINSITVSGRTLTYPSSSSAEERAVQWLIEDDLNTTVADKQSLRQRYVLGTLWFLNTTTGFGTDSHAATWTTNLDECNWSKVSCDRNGRVTDVELAASYVRGQIPADLGLLTDLTVLNLSGNQLSGTIPSSLGALTALTYADFEDNQLSATIPSSFVALTVLKYLYLNDNQLVGTMPFCNSDLRFDDLVADCAEVNCTCCTYCCPVAFGNITVFSGCERIEI